MATSDTSILGVFNSFHTLRASVSSLKALGCRDGDISVLFPEVAVSQTLSPDENRQVATRPNIHLEPLIGGTLGWLTYIDPDGAGAVSCALISLGVPAYEADRYERQIMNGRMLVCVRPPAIVAPDKAEEILARTGAQHITRTQRPETVALLH